MLQTTVPSPFVLLFRLFHSDDAFLFLLSAPDIHIDRMRREQPMNAFRPFDQGNTVFGVEKLVDAECKRRLRVVDPVKIQMKSLMN